MNIRNAYRTEDSDLILSGKENTKDTTKYYKVSEERLKFLIEAEEELNALESAGVDNWSGYDDVYCPDKIEVIAGFEEIIE